MPSPIGHALAGLIVHAASAERDALHNHKRALLLAGVAAAPDLDLLLRWLDGQGRHRAYSHSLGAAILAGVAVAVVARLARQRRPAALGLAAGLAWLSHVGLDFLGSDSFAPYGIMAFWPVSDRFVAAPIPIFMDIGRTLDWATVWQNAAATAWEAVVLLPLLMAVVRWRERRRS
jgi:membrane-bound metal-dependent hydrolase YbcI (DUF457 family)